MSYDEKATNLIGEIENLMTRKGVLGARNEGAVRCRSILNALEVQVEETAVPPDDKVVALLGEALCRQATFCGCDESPIAQRVDRLAEHLRRR